MTQTEQTASTLPLWTPRDPQLTTTHKFREFVNAKRHLSLATYQDLDQWSVTEIEAFWSDVWEFTGTKASAPYLQVLEPNKTMDQIP
ncbi:hypothetical protein EC988_009017, partial [Linderina pennispora]